MAQYDIPTPNTLLFRRLAPEDAQGALRLLEISWPAANRLGPAAVYTLADVTSDPAAAPFAACVVARDPHAPRAWIVWFVVAVPFRGRGLARRLVAETVTALRADGIRRVLVRATDPDGLLRLLLRAGVISHAGPPAQWCDQSAPGHDGPAWLWVVCDL
jgi:GNAT superfamily N-acetyltransferase